MGAWTFIAQRATTGEFLDWDVPIELGGLEWALSGPGSLRASVAPDVGGLRGSDGRPLLEEWNTLLYAESGGEIRWGGIVIQCSYEGEKWDLEAAGFSTYPHGIPYGGEYVRVGVDPADAVRHLWQHVQSYPDSDLGVTVTGDSTPVRLGDFAYATDENGVRLDFAIPHSQWKQLFDKGWRSGPVSRADVDDSLWNWLIDHGFTRASDDARGQVIVPPAVWSEEFDWWEAALLNIGWTGTANRNFTPVDLWQFLTSHGWASKATGTDSAPIPADPDTIYPPTMNDAMLQADDTITEAAPYQLLWWEHPDCGDEIDNLAKQAPFDWVEKHYWGPNQESIAHEIQIGYPRVGRRRDDLLFDQDVNVIQTLVVDSNGDDYANTVLGLGAGEGRSMLRRDTAVRDGRLRRVATYADKAVTDFARMDALIDDELNYRKAALRITSLDVVDHPNAPIGSWQIGDDVLVRAYLPWLGEVEMWVRITAWSLTGESTATLTVTRSDLFRYGGNAS